MEIQAVKCTHSNLRAQEGILKLDYPWEMSSQLWLQRPEPASQSEQMDVPLRERRVGVCILACLPGLILCDLEWPHQLLRLLLPDRTPPLHVLAPAPWKHLISLPHRSNIGDLHPDSKIPAWWFRLSLCSSISQLWRAPLAQPWPWPIFC